MRRIYKYIKLLIFWSIAGFITFYGILFLLFSLPFFQKQIRDIAEDELSRLLHTELTISTIQIEPFNKLSLENILLKDQNQDSLVFIGKISAGFELLPILQNRLIFNSIRLSDFNIRASKPDKDSPANFQFILEALASKDTTSQPMKFEMKLNSVLLRNGNVAFDIKSEPEKKGKFDSNHIAISDLSATVSLNILSADSLNTQVKRISLEEKSGFVLDNICFDIRGNKQTAILENFEIKLPSSSIAIDSLYVDYSKALSGKNILETSEFYMQMNGSQISPVDLKAFVPALTNFHFPIRLKMQASGSKGDISLKDLSINYGSDLLLKANGNLSNITVPEEAYLYGNVEKFDITSKGVNTIIRNFISENSALPDVINRIGRIRFDGNISGFFTNLVAYGNIRTAAGTVRTDILIGNDLDKNILSYNGKISTRGVNLGQILNQENKLGIVALSLDIDGQQRKGHSSSGKIDGLISTLELNGYRYNNITLEGKYLNKSFDGQFNIDDDNISLGIEGKVNLDRSNTSINITAEAKSIKPEQLKLLPDWKDSNVSFKLKADFTGREYDEIQGEINLDSLYITNNKETFSLDRLAIYAMNHQNPQIIRINSELFQAQIQGHYSFATLIKEIRNSLSQSIPVFKADKFITPLNPNDFDFTVNIQPTSKLSRVLNLPFSFEEKCSFNGFYRQPVNRLYFDGDFPSFRIGKMEFKDGVARASLTADQLHLRLRTQKLNKKREPLSLTLNASAQNGCISSNFSWSNIGQSTFSGSLITDVLIQKTDSRIFPLRTDIKVHPSTMIFNDSIWNVNESQSVIDSGRVIIDDFAISHNDQLLQIDGTLSKNEGDSLRLNLNKMSLDYIFQTLNISNVVFGGQGTGKFFLTHENQTPVIRTDNFFVKDFSYQNCHEGDLHLKAHWENETQGICMKGHIERPDARPTQIDGGIYLKGKDSININFKADRLPCDFVSVWTENILQGLNGKVSGDITLYGPFSALNVVGDANVENANFRIDYLNTEFWVSDSIHLRENGLFFNNVTVLDKFGNKASGSGTLNYHNFRDFTYDISVTIPQRSSFLAFNATEKQNSHYWGTIFANGTARIYGYDNYTGIDITARNAANSKFYFSLGDTQTAGDYQFITFNDKTIRHQVNDTILNTMHAIQNIDDEDSDHEMEIIIQMEVTPEAQISLIMDESTGDVIKGTGTGNIRLEYNKTNDIRLFGNCTIEKGSYYFNLQDVITRDFAITQGSTVSLHGEPLDADLDIQATYQVTANLTDLDESFAESKELSRPTVPVQCILNIDGALRRPDLSFDLKLPTVSQDIDRQVKNIISTDDMLNRQMLYLLVLNKFYTPEYTNNGQQVRNNELASVASSTLSSQLNNILGQISDNWNIGTNIRSDKGDFSDVEVELALSSQLLNNRLLFNGNLGYRDNENANTSFVGDFDLEYLLTPGGTLRLKAYNHYNDKNYSIKSSIATQGVGIMVKKDFSNISELLSAFTRNRRIKKENKKASPQ